MTTMEMDISTTINHTAATTNNNEVLGMRAPSSQATSNNGNNSSHYNILSHDMTPIDPLVAIRLTRNRSFSSPAGVQSADGRISYPLRQHNDPQLEAIKSSFKTFVDPRPFSAIAPHQSSSNNESPQTNNNGSNSNNGNNGGQQQHYSAARAAALYNRFQRDSLGTVQNVDGSIRSRNLRSASLSSSSSATSSYNSVIKRQSNGGVSHGEEESSTRSSMGLNAVLSGHSTDRQRERVLALLLQNNPKRGVSDPNNTPVVQIASGSLISGPAASDTTMASPASSSSTPQSMAQRKRDNQKALAAAYDAQIKEHRDSAISDTAPSGPNSSIVQQMVNLNEKIATVAASGPRQRAGSQSPLTKQEYEARESQRKELERMIDERRQARAEDKQRERALDLEMLSMTDSEGSESAGGITSSHRQIMARGSFKHQNVISGQMEARPTQAQQASYLAALNRQRQIANSMQQIENSNNPSATAPNQSIVEQLGKPGNGAPLVTFNQAQTGSIGDPTLQLNLANPQMVTHLHNLGSGDPDQEEEAYERTRSNRRTYKNTLDRQRQHKSTHPLESVENPAHLPQWLADPANGFDPDLKKGARKSTDLAPRPGPILNHIHERSTDDYFEFGLPGSGAPRLNPNNNNNNGVVNSEQDYSNLVDTGMPPRWSNSRVTNESARSYALTLDTARAQKAEIMAKVKREDQELEAKLSRENYNPFGRPGAGAPNPPNNKTPIAEPDQTNSISVAHLWKLGSNHGHALEHPTHPASDILKYTNAVLMRADPNEVKDYKSSLDAQLQEHQVKAEQESDSERQKNYQATLNMEYLGPNSNRGYLARMQENRRQRREQANSVNNASQSSNTNGTSLPIPPSYRPKDGKLSSRHNNGQAEVAASASSSDGEGKKSSAPFPWDKLGSDRRRQLEQVHSALNDQQPQ